MGAAAHSTCEGIVLPLQGASHKQHLPHELKLTGAFLFLGFPPTGRHKKTNKQDHPKGNPPSPFPKVVWFLPIFHGGHAPPQSSNKVPHKRLSLPGRTCSIVVTVSLKTYHKRGVDSQGLWVGEDLNFLNVGHYTLRYHGVKEPPPSFRQSKGPISRTETPQRCPFRWGSFRLDAML